MPRACPSLQGGDAPVEQGAARAGTGARRRRGRNATGGARSGVCGGGLSELGAPKMNLALSQKKKKKKKRSEVESEQTVKSFPLFKWPFHSAHRALKVLELCAVLMSARLTRGGLWRSSLLCPGALRVAPRGKTKRAFVRPSPSVTRCPLEWGGGGEGAFRPRPVAPPRPADLRAFGSLHPPLRASGRRRGRQRVRAGGGILSSLVGGGRVLPPSPCCLSLVGPSS